MNRPYIIAIDAVAGGGKTTLSKAVNEALYPSARYCFDEFDEPDIHPVDFYDWCLRGADIAEFDCPGIHQAVSDRIEKMTWILLFLISHLDESIPDSVS